VSWGAASWGAASFAASASASFPALFCGAGALALSEEVVVPAWGAALAFFELAALVSDFFPSLPPLSSSLSLSSDDRFELEIVSSLLNFFGFRDLRRDFVCSEPEDALPADAVSSPAKTCSSSLLCCLVLGALNSDSPCGSSDGFCGSVSSLVDGSFG